MLKITDNTVLLTSPGRTFDTYFEKQNLAVFDIETTGLNPTSSRLILSGIISVNSSGAVYTQLLAEDLSDEKHVIEETCSVLSKADIIITYNGRHFDIPFLKKRASAYGISVPDKYNLDLYTLVRDYSALGNMLSGLKQKNIEEFLGISAFRSDTISGYESVKLFERYLNTGSFALRDKILLHNADDIRQLYRLLPVIRSTDFHKAMFRTGFPVRQGYIRSCRLSGKNLIIKGILNTPCDYISFPTADAPYSVRAVRSDKSIEVIFPCESAKGVTFLDALRILGEDVSAAFERLPGVESGYLICSAGNEISYMEINIFVKEFFNRCVSHMLKV